ncbi:chitin synthase-domain-containing protein [Catenaria anguillulae PL171]|uniref:chitin synthase n=1 Tax=Catenaria anguillulae PL171 TaxID=765915 RepID=A0A1Y2HBM2_9FUNG|nr:chitin synthase-domain-containing protein [Catenaria anguillulae PL171]
MSDLINDNTGRTENDFSDIPNPFDFGNDVDFGPKPSDNIPPAALIVLQVLFYIMLAFILLYLVSHWIFHSWSFFNVFNMGVQKRRKPGASTSDKLIPMLVILMFILYTAYMVGFVYATVIMMQFTKYYRGFLQITTRQTRNQLYLLLWIIFAMALFPVVLNMIMAIIKLTKDWLFTRKLKNDLKDKVHDFVQKYPEHIQFSPAAPTSTDPKAEMPILPHSSSFLPNMTETLPLVAIFVPVYNEPLPNLMGALNGLAASDYPRIRIYVGFDNYDVEKQFFTLVRLMTGVPLKATTIPRGLGMHSSAHSSPMAGATDAHIDIDDESIDLKSDMGRKAQKYNGFDQIVTHGSPSIRASMDVRTPGGASPMYRPSMDHPNITTPQGSMYGSQFFSDAADNDLGFDADNCPDEYTLEYRGVRFSINRFPHSGKLGTQRQMFERLQMEMEEEGHSEAPLVLFVDSDTSLAPDTVSQLVGEMQRHPQTKACTGFVVSRNEDSGNFWRIMQDAEYIESMIFRNAEALMGAVTCLPGVLTMFKYHVLHDVANEYFYQPPIGSTFEFCQRYLGEDRYMTHILMTRPGTHTLGFNSHALCKTEAPDNFMTLLRQRRRWFLGTISNEIIMLCTPEFWVKFPLLMLTKFFMVLKVGGAITYVLIMELLFNLIFDISSVPWGMFIWLGIIIIPNWLFVTAWAISEKRLKSVLIFPVYYWFSPFFTIVLLMYSFLTVRERTWGGPRAAAAGGADGDADESDGQSVEEAVVMEPMHGQQARNRAAPAAQ